MPPTDLIGLGIKAAEKIAANASQASGIRRSLINDIPEIFAGQDKRSIALYNRAIEMAPSQSVLEQLAETRKVATELSQARIERIKPNELRSLTYPSAVDLSHPDKQETTAAFLQILPNDNKRLLRRISTQLVSNNLFKTVPVSTLGLTSFSTDMFEDQGVFRSKKFKKPDLEVETSLRQAVLYGHLVKVTLSEYAGDAIATVFGGATHMQQLTREINSSKQLCASLQMALSERAILGDKDWHPYNIRVLNTRFERVFKNIDVDERARMGSTPELCHAFNEPIFDFDRQPLDHSITSRIGRFVDAYGGHRGRQMFADLQMAPQEIDDTLSRAQWFVDHQTLPPITLYDPGLD
jgi:hypothetical protein